MLFKGLFTCFLVLHTPPVSIVCYISLLVCNTLRLFLAKCNTQTHTLAVKRLCLLKLESYLKVKAVFCRGEFKQYIYKTQEKKTKKKKQTNICIQTTTIRFDLVQHKHTHSHTNNVKRYLHFKYVTYASDTCNVFNFLVCGNYILQM